MPANATYAVGRDSVITSALQVSGGISKGEAPDATDIADCMVFLQSMLKHWDTLGKKGYVYQTQTFPAVAAKASYSIGLAGDVAIDRPIDIVMAYTYGVTALDKQPLFKYTKTQFETLTPGNQPGPANGYFYDPQLILGTFNPWPVPADTTRSFAIVVQRPIADLANTSNAVFDVPQEAYLALIFGLGELVGRMFGGEEKTMQWVERKAKEYLDAYGNFAEEDGSLYFQINTQGRGR